MNGFLIGNIIASPNFKEKDGELEEFVFEKKDNELLLSTIITFSTIKWLSLKNKDEFNRKELQNKFKENYSKQIRVFSTDLLISTNPIGWYSTSMDQIRSFLKLGFKKATRELRIAFEVFNIGIFMLRNNMSKKAYLKYIKDNYEFDVKKINPKDLKITNYLKQALNCVFSSSDYLTSMINCVCEDKVSDDVIYLTSIIAEAYFDDIPEDLIKSSRSILPKYLKDLLVKFNTLLDTNNL